MKTHKFETKEEQFEFRRGKITGSKLQEIVTFKGNGVKSGKYKLLADYLVSEDEDDVVEDPRDRGSRLEPEAVARFEKETGKKVDSSIIVLTRDEDECIAVSPDGLIGKTEALEVKCLAREKHIEAYLTKKIPGVYEMQVLQYFIVSDKLKRLYFAFYHPGFPKGLDFFFVEKTREELKDDIETYLSYQTDTLKWVRETVAELTF